MLYQPSYPQPYSSDIDATIQNNFTCYINAEGGTQVTAYTLKINNLDGTVVYTTDKTILTTPLYGESTLSVPVIASGMVNGGNYMWNITLFESTPDIWVTSNILQTGNTTTTIYLQPSYLLSVGQYIKIGAEIKQIATYDNSNGKSTVSSAFSTAPSAGTYYTVYTDNVISSNYYFQARTTPTLVMGTVPTTITSKSYTFTAVYTQAENVGWKYYQWSLYNSNGVVIEQSNEITTGAIQYTFDGLIDTTTYGIGLILENQDGVKLSAGITYFAVDYASPSVTNVPTTNVLCDKDAIQLSWDKILVNAGIAEGTGTEPYYSLVANQPYTGGSSVQMESNSSHIYWYVGSSASPVDISLNSTTYLYWTTNDELFSGNIVLLTGVKSQLIAISLGAPSTCETGDRYYNTNTNLIYTAISTNTWGTTGETPNLSVIYYNLQDSISYIYNGSGMVSTTNGVPECTLSISTVSGSRRYKFAYAVWNGASTIYNTNPYLNTSTQWLLQSTTTPVFNTDNIWNDSAVWSDTAYWVDSYSVNDYWYKLALQSNALNITKIIKS
jgi:hypothetical protein